MPNGKSIAEQVGVMDESLAAGPPPDQQPLEPERPEWLPPNFNAPEDLAKAYEESRREMSRAQTRAEQSERAVAELAQQMEELRQAQQQAQFAQQGGYDPSSDPIAQQVMRSFSDMDEQQFLQALDARTYQIAQAAFQQYQPPQQQGPTNDPELYATVVMREMQGRYGDEWTPEMMQEVGEAARPYLTAEMPFQQTVQTLSFVADAIRNRKLVEQQQSEQQHAEQSARAKRLSQTAPGGNGRPSGAMTPEDAWAERVAQVARKPYWAQ